MARPIQLAAALVLVTVAAGAPTTLAQGDDEPVAFESMHAETLYEGRVPIDLPRQFRAVETQAELDAFYDRIDGEAPDVDFDEAMVLLAVEGSQGICPFVIEAVQRAPILPSVAASGPAAVRAIVDQDGTEQDPADACTLVYDNLAHLVTVEHTPGIVVFQDDLTHEPLGADQIGLIPDPIHGST